ncbi:MAG TPA: malate/lactate/ureidoglycolate dehydrogenase [Anaeromyxobacteraceae bacterium]|nr:malate/lactate/ureidoglycolate dehydrogenase [Anaeromyxobacteraceae bacterium]
MSPSDRSPGSVAVHHDRLRALGARILAGAGAAAEDARAVADHLVDANLSGHDSHGVGMLPHYVRAIRAGVLDPRAHAAVEDGGGAVLAVDGRKGFGQVVASQAIAAGMARARSTGVALVALRNAFHVGRVGAYAEQAIAEALVSIHFVNVVGHPPLVAPFRGSDARFATNPVCIGFPGGGGKPPVVLDFATSLVALGKVRVALARGERVPEGILLDAGGRPTTDPAVMYREPRGAILPFGLHKGYGLAFLCELLAGALTGGGTISTVAYQQERITNNMLSFLVDPQRLPGAAELDAQIAAAVEHVKASPPADPALPVLVAGDPERAWRARRLAEGIPVERATWEELRVAASSVGAAFDAA